MAYTKQTWQDEQLQGTAIYTITAQDGSIIAENAQINMVTPVNTAGTRVTAARMNNMENGIEAAANKADNPDIAGIIQQLNNQQYPVGVEVLTLSNESPAARFGGTAWQQLQVIEQVGYTLYIWRRTA